ncbi:MAG: CBS domain-containing protein [Proteobacteria bacterium]|nr:CBS domain-containing protein [Pseudomonadota bacterium]
MNRSVPPVSECMTSNPHTVASDQPLAAAHQLMRTHAIRHLPVVDGGKLVGVVSMDDLHLIETLKNVELHSVPIADAMTPEPFIVVAEEPLDRVLEYMIEHKIGSAIVMGTFQSGQGNAVTPSVTTAELGDGDGMELVGVFTTSDAMQTLLRLLRRSDPLH